MHVAVCVKQIPDPSAPGRLDPATGALVREGKFVMDDSDSYGVEMALQLVQMAGGGEVTVISMAPDGQIKGVKDALAMGADNAIVVSDAALAGSDALGTAKVLAAAVARAGAVDLVLAATESTDGYTGTMPVQLAALLDLPSVTFAKKVACDGSKADGLKADGLKADGLKVIVERQTDDGYDEVECLLPALVTVTAGVVEPRYPSFKAIMAAKTKPCDVVNLADLGLDPSEVGGAGSRQEVVEVMRAENRKAGELIDDDGQAHLRIVSFLESLKVI